jgi:hypothetical protein
LLAFRPLKEGSAASAQYLLLVGILRAGRGQQRASQDFDRKHISPRPDYQLAELVELACFEPTRAFI